MSDLSKARTSAAVLVLLRKVNSLPSVLLIERSLTVKTHRGQVAFPGGGMEVADGGDPVVAALRECHEEVGIPASQVKVVRALPPLPTLTSSFFVHAVLAEWNVEHEPELKLDPEEVAHAEWVRIDALLETRRIENGFPVFDWQGADSKTRKMWGLSAVIFDLLFRSDDPSL